MLTADMSSRVRRATLSEHSYFMAGPMIRDPWPYALRLNRMDLEYKFGGVYEGNFRLGRVGSYNELHH